jgi:CheY-like chemotaxis protein
MDAAKKALLRKLCEQAAAEHDFSRMLELVRQINQIVLPEQRINKAAAAPNVTVPSTPGNNRLLLADDSHVVRMTLKKLLQERYPTWDIFEAENGHQVLEQVPAVKPHLLILDMNLPDTPGREVSHHVRKISPETKIILCSASDPGYLAVMAQQLGADAYFSKISDSDELHRTISSVMAS